MFFPWLHVINVQVCGSSVKSMGFARIRHVISHSDREQMLHFILTCLCVASRHTTTSYHVNIFNLTKTNISICIAPPHQRHSNSDYILKHLIGSQNDRTSQIYSQIATEFNVEHDDRI